MARYFLRFRHSDTGLTPGFTFFDKASDFSAQAAPTVFEALNGTYYFDYIPTFDIVFEVDGGASIPTEEIRYISDTISPKDSFVDEPTSQVKDDVWNDALNRSTGTKGDFVEHVGVNTDAVDAATVFGQVYKARDVVLGGTGFGGTGVDVKTAYDRIGLPALASVSADIAAINLEVSPTAVADAVWDAVTAGNVGAGTMGGLVNTAASGSAPSAATVAAAVWNEALAGHLGVGSTGEKLNSGAVSAGTIAASVWDEAAASHVIAGSFGQALQNEDSGLVQGGASTTVTLRAGASAITDFYKNGLVEVTSGTGAKQSRSITAYDGATKIATIDRVWGMNPIAGDGYIVHPAAPSSSLTTSGIAAAVWDEAAESHVAAGSFGQALQNEDSGLVQAAASTTVTLRAGASAVTDFYKNGLIEITSGTGAKQSRSITAYNGATKIATVDRSWVTTPLSGDGYVVHPAAPSSSLTEVGIAGAVWDESVAAHTLPGSTGAKLSAGSGVKFLANGDTVNPVVLQVSSPKHTQVKITFSEPVVMTTGANGALNLGNYNIPGLTLIAVSSLTSQQVLLTTSAQTPDFLYSLSVINVEDLVGNPIL